MTKEIELAAEAEYPEKLNTSHYLYNPIQRDCQAAFIKGAKWMATRDRWVSVDEVDLLPKFRKKVLCWGEAAGASPSMGGPYQFISYRDELPDLKIITKRIDENGFVAAYVLKWQELPSPPSLPL